MITIIEIFLSLLMAYFGIGFLLGIYFIFQGSKVDILLADSKKRVRFLLFFGVLWTWPFLISKVFKRS